MFSGIIETQGNILAIRDGTFTVAHAYDPSELGVGESIAHDGACMSLTSISADSYTFFAMEETFRRTNFGDKQVGDTFNVERSLRLGDRLDGHLVAGHVDTVGTVTGVTRYDDRSEYLQIEFDRVYNAYIVPKGSIAVNGVSLTIVDAEDGWFSVSLIPLTQEMTNLSKLKIGSRVNLEFDSVGKYILRSQAYPPVV